MGGFPVAETVSGQDEANPVRSQWLPGRVTWARSGFPALVSLEKNSVFSHNKNKFVVDQASRWLYVVQVPFRAFIDHDFVSLLGQSSAILTSRLVNNAYIIQQSYADGREISNYSIVGVLFFMIP